MGVKRKHGELNQEQFACDFSGCGRSFAKRQHLTFHLHSHSVQNAPPASYEGWKQHFKYKHIFGLPDGRVWSCESGRFLQGYDQYGYVHLNISGNNILRHRLNFEIATGRAIGADMEVDHIVPPPTTEDGSKRASQDDSWDNLQELTGPEHKRKTLADNPERGKKAGITKGFPVIALHVKSGREERYDSINDAVSSLGLALSTIATRIKQRSSKEVHGYVFRQCPEHVAEQADRSCEVWKGAIMDGRLVNGVRVSTLGRIQFQDGRRTEGIEMLGRRHVKIRLGQKWLNIKIYQIMAHTFIGPRPSLEHTVDHIDGNCLNDVLTNLRWSTRKEQNRNRTANRTVSKFNLEGELLEKYETMAEAAEKNNLTWDRIRYAANTGSTATGFRWKTVLSDR